MMTNEQAPAGWYTDPEGSGQQRYWTGTEWTGQYTTGTGHVAAKKGLPTAVKVAVGAVGVLAIFGACGSFIDGQSETLTGQTAQTAPAETGANELESRNEQAGPDEEQIETPELTVSQENALGSAESYLSMGGFSRSGLIEQLEFEGYSLKDATFAVKNVGADWNEQAAMSAESYMDTSNFSRVGLIDQLEFEGFTSQQAEYGADSVGL